MTLVTHPPPPTYIYTHSSPSHTHTHPTHTHTPPTHTQVASEKLDEIIEWQQMIEEVKSKLQNQAQATLKQQQVLNQQARQKKIALEMSDLVFYCRPVPFNLESESCDFCDI